MFTKTQGQELIDHTTSTWTTINGVNGRKFTSKTDSSKYIFLPAGGYWWDLSNNTGNSYGFYWSAVINTPDTSTAWNLNFHSSNVGMNNRARIFAYSIRSIRNR